MIRWIKERFGNKHHCDSHRPNDGNSAQQINPNRETNRILQSLFDEYRTESAKTERRDKKKAVLDFLTLVVVTVYTFVTVLLWCAQQTNNRINQQSLIDANRAWIDPASMLLIAPLENGGPVRIQIHIINTGHEPAMNVVYKFIEVPEPYVPNFAKNEPVLQPVQACDGLIPKAEGFTAFPNANVDNWIPYSFDDTPADNKITSDVANRRVSLIIDGCFAYETMGQQAQIPFRFFLRDIQGQASFSYSPNGTAETANWYFNALPTNKQEN